MNRRECLHEISTLIKKYEDGEDNYHYEDCFNDIKNSIKEVIKTAIEEELTAGIKHPMSEQDYQDLIKENKEML